MDKVLFDKMVSDYIADSSNTKLVEFLNETISDFWELLDDLKSGGLLDAWPLAGKYTNLYRWYKPDTKIVVVAIDEYTITLNYVGINNDVHGGSTYMMFRNDIVAGDYSSETKSHIITRIKHELEKQKNKLSEKLELVNEKLEAINDIYYIHVQ